MKRVAFILAFFLCLISAHHLMVYLHEWTHGTVAWLLGYKRHPFDIHYGSCWFTLWDIDEAVNYQKIYSDGHPFTVAWIAIAPTLLQMTLFPISFRVLFISLVRKYRLLFVFTYFFTLFLLAEIYAYIPIRTFSKQGDIFNFLTATNISPWVIAVPGTLYVFYGLYQFLSKALPLAYTVLNTTKEWMRFSVALLTLAIFFGYYGGVGFTVHDPVSHLLSLLSWAFFLLAFLFLCVKRKSKCL